MKKSVYSIAKISTITCLIMFFFTIGVYQLAGAKDVPAVEKNMAQVKRLVEIAYNQRDLGAVDEIIAPDYIGHMNGKKNETAGPAMVKNHITENLGIYPDFKVTIEDIFGQGDKVALRWIFQGTHKAFGKQMTTHGIFIGRFADGKIVEGWQMFDNLGSSEKLGFKLIPPPAPDQK